MSNIKLVRLISGEEIIAKVEAGIEAGEVRLVNPAIILIQQPKNPTDGMQIGIVPWVPYVDTTKGITVKHTHIVFQGEPDRQMLAKYNERFGGIPGLVLPNLGRLVSPSAEAKTPGPVVSPQQFLRD